MRERDSHPTPAAIVSVTKLDVVSPDQSFSYLPKKNYHISFSSPFLRIKVKQIQSVPVVKMFCPSNIGQEVLLDPLNRVNGFLVIRSPQLATIVQLGLDKAFPQGDHHTSTPPLESSQTPPS